MMGGLGITGWMAGTGMITGRNSTEGSGRSSLKTSVSDNPGLIEMDNALREQPADREPDIANHWPLLESLASQARYPLSLRNRPQTPLDRHRQECREQLYDRLGVRPDSHPLQMKRIEREEHPEFIREKIIFETAPGVRVPAWIHVPKRLSGPAPAIIDLHSHGGMFLYGKEKVIDFGGNGETMDQYHLVNYEGRPTATALVRRGYVVITTDAMLFGERRVMTQEDLDRYGWDRSAYSTDVVRELNLRCRAKANVFVKSMAWLGMSWPGFVLRDDIRTIDLLMSLPEVDPRRIGCLGVSFGGWRTLLLAGMDDRIGAACVTGFMSRVAPMLRNHVNTHSWVHFMPGIHRDLDLPDVVGLRAPLPLMVQQCRRDGLFPLEGMEDAVSDLEQIYQLANASSSFDGRFYDERHIFNRQMQEEAFDWLDQHLKS